MPGRYTFEIETVYSSVEEKASGWRLRILGAMVLVVAAGWLFVTWEPMYKWVNRSIALGELHAAMGAMATDNADERSGQGELNAFMGMVGGAANQSRSSRDSEADPAGRPTRGKRQMDPQKLADAQFAMALLPKVGYGWLGITSLGGLWLLMCAVSAVAPDDRASLAWRVFPAVVTGAICAALGVARYRWGWTESTVPSTFLFLVMLILMTAGSAVAAAVSPGSGVRRFGLFLLLVAIASIGGLVLFANYRWGWVESNMPPWAKPVLLGLVVLFAGSLGAVLNRSGVRLLRASGVIVILSALVSVAAIWAAVRWGKMPDEHVDLALYARVFGTQSACGWVTLVGLIGLK